MAGAQFVPCSAAELVWRRESETLTGGGGSQQTAGSRRSHQPILHLRQVAYILLYQGPYSVCYISLAFSRFAITRTFHKFTGTIQYWFNERNVRTHAIDKDRRVTFKYSIIQYNTLEN